MIAVAFYRGHALFVSTTLSTCQWPVMCYMVYGQGTVECPHFPCAKERMLHSSNGIAFSYDLILLFLLFY